MNSAGAPWPNGLEFCPVISPKRREFLRQDPGDAWRADKTRAAETSFGQPGVSCPRAVQLVARRENARVEALRRCENARAVVGSDKGRTRESEHQAR